MVIAVVEARDLEPGDIIIDVGVECMVVGVVVPDDAPDMVKVIEQCSVPTIQRLRSTLRVRILRGEMYAHVVSVE